MASPSLLRLGTRGSALARWQADWVADQLRQQEVNVEIILISTTGDTRVGPLSAGGSPGLFTKEIQAALLRDEIDIAVHSLKDLPTQVTPGLQLAAVPLRASPWDVLVSNQADELEALAEGARVGTGSPRRRAQLLNLRPDLEVSDVRGNVDTRLRKLDEDQYDALILAEAGLQRLELGHRITQVLAANQMLPAVGQGALGVEIRDPDQPTRKILESLNDPTTAASVTAERTVLATLQAGCLAPVATWGRIENEQLQLDALVLSENGDQRLSAQAQGSLEEAAAVGESVAQQLLQQGAARLIEAAHPDN
ncbi:MAG: hydroxymethylbilane synthase [Pirellulaceae bacterium]|nr:hydroxymethylbilane synthase [Pirellulaceae bacterium]